MRIESGLLWVKDKEILCEDNKVYITTPSLSEGDFKPSISEWVCADICRRLGIPNPQVCAVYFEGKRYFGSTKLKGSKTLYSYLENGGEFSEISNIKQIPLILLLDIFSCNLHRSYDTILVNRNVLNPISFNQSEMYQLSYSHLPIKSYKISKFLSCNLLNSLCTWGELLNSYNVLLGRITPDAIRDVVFSTPVEWWDKESDPEKLIQFLIHWGYHIGYLIEQLSKGYYDMEVKV